MEGAKQMEYYKMLREHVGAMPLILPGAVVIMKNEEGEVLLQKRPEGRWGLPGGLMNLGESFEQVAKREVFEEIGLRVDQLELVHVFSGEDYYTKAENGDEFYSVTAVYLAKKTSGILALDPTESLEVRYFNVGRLPEKIVGSHREFIDYTESREDT